MLAQHISTKYDRKSLPQNINAKCYRNTLAPHIKPGRRINVTYVLAQTIAQHVSTKY